jgi:hypothetical protein
MTLVSLDQGESRALERQVLINHIRLHPDLWLH